MQRFIVCRECAPTRISLSSEDKKQGWKIRKLYVSLRNQCACDTCVDILPAGTIAIAETLWQGTGNPREWEEEFGNVLPADAVRTLDALTK